MEQVKIKKDGKNRLVEPPKVFWTEYSPEQIDGNAEFFSPVAGELGAQAGDPYSTNGALFRVFCGKPWENYAVATFMVERVIKVVDKPGTPEVQERFHWRPVVRRIDDWLHTGEAKPAAPEVEPPREEYVREDGQVKWNPGKKVHEVIVDDAVVFSSAVKQEALDVATGATSL